MRRVFCLRPQNQKYKIEKSKIQLGLFSNIFGKGVVAQTKKNIHPFLLI